MLGRVRPVTLDPLVAAAVDWLGRGTGRRRIGDLARYIGLSQSALERRFRRVIGTSPRRFLSIVRLQRATRLLENCASITAAAHAVGYFDQSHFIHDFRKATGPSPRAFFRHVPNR
jgi:AraC-like DNA-binding protein